MVCCPFNTGIMYVILCPWYGILLPWPWHNVCYSAFLILSTAPSTPAQCMLFYVPDILYCPFNPGTMYAILCPWYVVLPLHHRHNVYYSMSLIWYPAPLTPAQHMLFCVSDFSTAPATPAQCLLFYVPDIVACPFNTGTIYVCLCPWYSNPPLWRWHNVCYSMFLKKYTAPLTPAKCMSFYVPAIVSHSFNPGSMYIILCSCYSMFQI